MDTEPKLLWSPSKEQVANSNLTKFAKEIEAKYHQKFPDYAALWQWSVDELEAFWSEFWDFAEVKAQTKGSRILIDGDKMPGAKFFPDARLNFAENLLVRRDDGLAIQFHAEDKLSKQMTWNELYDLVSRLVKAMTAAGVKPHDRIAGFVPNMPEAVAAMLASSALGAIWTSCSPDFGHLGVIDRFGQTAPKFLFTADGYYYNGKQNHSLAKIAEWIDELPSVEAIIVFPLLSQTPDLSPLLAKQSPKLIIKDLADFIKPFPAVRSDESIPFVQLEFNHPLYIMYTSGTTGKPKCIIHCAGGALLMHLKEHLLHCNAKPNDRIFFFTTCGWMMWNWLITGLATKASIMLYDGSPFAPDGYVLFNYAEKDQWSLFGTSAKFIDACSKQEIVPMGKYDLSTVRTICSTGSPLAPEGFDYIYEKVAQDVQLSSISGGTDLLGCFILGNPNLPVYRGEIQSRPLGMAVAVYGEEGEKLYGTQGELVCEKPFPTMPLGFWGDESGQRYHEAYFDKFPNIWTHGDFVQLNPTGGMIVFGRSDATLNPGGVRIGTAEIYRQVEAFSAVAEAIVIGQEWELDTRVILFVKMQAGQVLTDDLIAQIKQRIKTNCTPRHVPAKVIAIADIPRTRSGKITELAVRDIIHNRKVKNKEALANPEALALFENLKELK